MLTTRPLSVWDAWFCWRLDRDAGVRDTAIDPTPPTFWGHVRWMCAWLFKRDRQAWVIGALEAVGYHNDGWGGEVCLGYVKMGLARAKADGTISIATLPAQRGRGVGILGVRVATEYAERAGWTPTATIRADNGPSIGLFAKAGYEMTDARGGWVVMQRPAA